MITNKNKCVQINSWQAVKWGYKDNFKSPFLRKDIPCTKSNKTQNKQLSSS